MERKSENRLRCKSERSTFGRDRFRLQSKICLSLNGTIAVSEFRLIKINAILNSNYKNNTGKTRRLQQQQQQ